MCIRDRFADAQWLAVEHHPALLGPIQPSEHVEQRGLAGAIGAQQAADLAATDAQVNAMQGLQATEELLT